MPDPSQGKAVMEVESMVVSTEKISRHDIPSTNPLVGGEIPIAPISTHCRISHRGKHFKISVF